MRKIVLLSCVSKKLRSAAAAKDLYTSPLFKKSYSYAIRKDPDSIFILSAEHGLLHPDTIIDPYEKTLNRMPVAERKMWASKVIQDLSKQCDLEKDLFLILAGRKYCEFLLPHLRKVENPMAAMGIGKRLNFLSQ